MQQAQPTSQPCITYFCGCRSLSMSEFDPTNTDYQVDGIIFLLALFILVVVLGSIKIGMDWFLYKDFYPLKQKSPILCIMLIMSICGQIILYPILYIIQYFTNSHNNHQFRVKFRAVQAGLEFSIFAIYLLRCLRIAYAHNTHSSRSKHFSFRIFQKQYILGTFVGILSIIKIIVVLAEYFTNSQSQFGTIMHDFSLSVQWQIPLQTDQSLHLNHQLQFIRRTIIMGFFWHCILVYCLYLHKNVNSRYSMRLQLLLVIITDLLTSMATIVLLGRHVTSYHQVDASGQQAKLINILGSYCNYAYNTTNYPTTEIFKAVNLLLILGISIIMPLFQTKVYHALLPTGRHYGFIKTMRDFLMEEEFRRVFTKYLEYLDQNNGNNVHMTLLEFWKKMMVIKINRKQAEVEKLESLKNLINQVQDILFVDQSQLIINLKDSIVGLEESLQNSQNINEKVDELEKMALERLDRIYVKSYTQTESYQHLKLITQDYKRINLNLIMLNLAIIVDSENSFT